MRLLVAKPTLPLCRGPTRSLFWPDLVLFLFSCARAIDDLPYYDLEFVMAWRNESS